VINAYALAAMPDREWWSAMRARSLEQDAIFAELDRMEQPEPFDAALFREAVLLQAPLDLKALGVPLPATCWRKAVDELHRIEAFNLARVETVVQILAPDLLARQSWRMRGAPYQPWRSLDGCAAVRVDLEPADLIEAELQAGYSLKSLFARLADLDFREKKGQMP